MNLRPDSRITPRIRLVRPIGSGGMGAVWAAYHETLKTEVAVKLVHGDKCQHADARARFAREAAIAAKLKSPHVTPTYDHGALADGTPYIVMELLEGECLAARLKRGPLTLYETSLVIAQVAQVLGKAHRLGIIHRDIKPGNLFLIDSDYELFVKLLDFGIAKAQASTASLELTRPGHMVGSPAYMSPEQLSSAKTVDHRADLWALAVVAYRCLTTASPFKGATLGDIIMAILEQSYQPISVARPVLPKTLDRWFAKAFHANLEERFQNAKALASSLMEITRSAAGPKKPALPHLSITDMTCASLDSRLQIEQTAAIALPHTQPSEEPPTQQLATTAQSLETATLSPAATTVDRTSATSRASALLAMIASLLLGAIGGHALFTSADAKQIVPSSPLGRQSDRISAFQENAGTSKKSLQVEQVLDPPRPSTGTAAASASVITVTTTTPAQVAPKRTSSTANISPPKTPPSPHTSSSVAASATPIPSAAPTKDLGF